MIFKPDTKHFLIAAATAATAVFAGAFAMTGAFAQTPANAVTLAPGQFKVGMEITYPPFESYDGDKVVGSDPDFSRALAKQFGASEIGRASCRERV